MEMKEAADIQSAPVAIPFMIGGICPLGHVEVAGGFGLGKPGNGYIEGKREPDYDPGPR